MEKQRDIKRVRDAAVYSQQGRWHLNEDRAVVVVRGVKKKIPSFIKNNIDAEKNKKSKKIAAFDEGYENDGQEITKQKKTKKKKKKDAEYGAQNDEQNNENKNVDEDNGDEGEGDDGKVSFFAVFDGHGGKIAAEILTANLYKSIINESTLHLFEPSDADTEINEDGIKGAILEGFANTEKEILRLTAERGDYSGSCAVVVILVRNLLFAANLGDSRAVVGRRAIKGASPFKSRGDASSSSQTVTVASSLKSTLAGFATNTGYAPYPLTKDQKATTGSEIKRVKKAGGWIHKNRVYGSLAIARAFGDRALKGEQGASLVDSYAGVVPEPRPKASNNKRRKTEGAATPSKGKGKDKENHIEQNDGGSHSDPDKAEEKPAPKPKRRLSRSESITKVEDKDKNKTTTTQNPKTKELDEKQREAREKHKKQREQRVAKRTEEIRKLIAKHGPCKPGVVSAVPEITVHTLTHRDDFVMIASDGLWDVIESKEAVAVVGRRLWKQHTIAQWGMEEHSLQDICQHVCMKGVRRCSADDITTIIVLFE